jgi:hypothetical protein
MSKSDNHLKGDHLRKEIRYLGLWNADARPPAKAEVHVQKSESFNDCSDQERNPNYD